MTQQVLERVAGYERRFNTLFGEYFETLSAGVDAPSFSRFTPECLQLLRGCPCGAASGCTSSCCMRRLVW